MGAAGCGIPAKLIWDLAAADGAQLQPKAQLPRPCGIRASPDGMCQSPAKS